MPTELQRKLEEFEELSTKIRSKFSNSKIYSSHAFSINETDRSIDLWMSALIHGDEVAGIDVLNTTIKTLLNNPELSCSLAFSLGNVEAALCGKRFLDRDLNRSFALSNHTAREVLRADQLGRIAERTKFAIDFHQTVEPSVTPFFVLPDHPLSLAFCNALESSYPKVTFPLEGFSLDGKMMLERVLAGPNKSADAKDLISSKSASFAIELGAKGFSETQAEAGVAIALKAMEIINSKSSFLVGAGSTPIYRITASIFNKDGAQLMPGLINFMDVKKGQVLGHSRTGELVSPCDGKLLFPKYGDLGKSSPELADIATPYL